MNCFSEIFSLSMLKTNKNLQWLNTKTAAPLHKGRRLFYYQNKEKQKETRIFSSEVTTKNFMQISNI